MKKLALCAGHYLGTEGRRCLKRYDPNETQEWVLNARVADEVQRILSQYNLSILRIDDPEGKQYIPLAERTAKGNARGADFWLGIHHNAGVNGGSGGGISAYVYTSPDAESLDWQKRLYDRLIALNPELRGNRATPLAKANLAECRDTKMPSVLLELGFMDSSVDVPIIITPEHVRKCARAIADVIIEKMQLTQVGFTEPAQTVVYFGGAPLKIGDAKLPVYGTSELMDAVGSLFPGEEVNILCSVGKTYAVLYGVTGPDGLPTGVKKVGFIAIPVNPAL